MLTKIEEYSQVELIKNGYVQLRKTTTVLDSGSVISTSHHREVRTPDDSIEDLPSNLSGSINAFWSEEVIADYRTHVSASAG